MIWVAWRQHRSQLVVATAALAAIAAYCIVTGPEIAEAFRASGAQACVSGGGCIGALDGFLDRYESLRFTIPLFLVLPMLIGVFWGAPLIAREFEHGTHRLAWTQGVTPSRWLAIKLSVLSVAAVVVILVLTRMLEAWSRPLVLASDHRFVPGSFDLVGIVPVGYAVFALALGTAAGTAIRRTVPAMGVTLVGFVAARLVLANVVRPHLATPRTGTYPLLESRPRMGLGDWVLSTHTVDRFGRFVSDGVGINFSALQRQCPGLPAPSRAVIDTASVDACVRRIGMRVAETYQPGTRFWWFQAAEFAIFIVLAAALLALTVRWIRRRSH